MTAATKGTVSQRKAKEAKVKNGLDTSLVNPADAEVQKVETETDPSQALDQ